MVFSSIPFIFFFLPIVLLFYYIVPLKFKNYILLIFSLIFYAWGEPVYILLMIFSCLLNYLYGMYANKTKHKKLMFILCIIINIGILGFFKYSNLLISLLNSILNTNLNLLDLKLPIGISFFTFQTMSYSIDIYKNRYKPEKNFFYFATYVSMFPQLIAGPIVRYEDISKELYKREINFSTFCNGLTRFLQGLFKKVLLANNIGILWTTISANNSNSILTAWLGLFAFTLQIYYDFSGYSDMAIGMGKMLGFNYLENFDYPYISKSITEFWHRWHMSLSNWFKDYVYIPLGGNRQGARKQIRNILIVWMLTGLWHGANYNFLLWGLYYGIILLIEKFILHKFLDKLPNIFKHLYTLFLVMIGWLIFNSENISFFLNYLNNLFNFKKYLFIDQASLFYILNYGIILLFGIIFSVPISKKINNICNKNKPLNSFLVTVYILLFVICISYLVSDSYNPFLYFRF